MTTEEKPIGRTVDGQPVYAALTPRPARPAGFFTRFLSVSDVENLADRITAAIQDSVDTTAGFKGARFSLNGTGWDDIARQAVIDTLRAPFNG